MDDLVHFALLVGKLHDILTTMYARRLELPNYSFFLFGPRGTGKTTWLREKLPHALWKNLLLDQDYLPLLGDSSLLAREVEARPPGSWVVVDEIQRIPALLNQVHDLISRFGRQYSFAMSGSSARKLKRMDVNLLAGRAIERKMFPFTASELGDDFELHRALRFGSLPPVIEAPDYAVDILTTYVGTYLKQEIQQEALVEDVGSFHRFLKVAGIMNGESLNISSIARDAAVARTTAQRYFDILEDTLVGFRLPGWQPRLKVREQAAPKFYFIDTGIVRTLTQRVREPLSDLEIGKLMETQVLHELRAAMAYQGIGGELHYWRTAAGVEVDFIWTRGEHAVAIEVTSSAAWRSSNGKALQQLLDAKVIDRAFGVYQGERAMRFGSVEVLPYFDFVKRLSEGEILVAQT